MKNTAALSWLLATATLLIFSVSITGSSAVVIPLPVAVPNNSPPYVLIREDAAEPLHLSKRGGDGGGGHERRGYTPGGTGSGNQFDKGKPYGRSLAE